MRQRLRRRLARLGASLSAFFGIKRKDRRNVTRQTWRLDEIKDIDNVIETFNGLVARLCHDGNQMGELYVKAEEKAARYALLSETVIDSVSSGILVVESMGNVALANSAARLLLGLNAQAEIAGKRLAEILDDSGELESLVAENFKTSTNASRRIINVRARGGKDLCLGASTSCVSSAPPRVDAVIVVFTELGGRPDATATRGASEAGGAAFPSYLRGVLDCYDHFSSIVKEVEGIQVKLDKGVLDPSDVADCVAATRRAWETMTAFSLSLVAQESLTELADATGVIKAVLGRRKDLAEVTLALASEDLPRVKTIRKVLEAGLEMLLVGCVADSSGGVAVAVGPAQGPYGETVEIKVTEQAPRSRVRPIGESLREFRSDQDLRREAGLMLLRSLSSENHRVALDEREGNLVVRIVFAAPAKHGNPAGPAAQRGDASERGPDGV